MSDSINPLDAEDTIGVVLTYDELRLLVTSLKSDGDHQTSTLRDPLLARLNMIDQCAHEQWDTTLVDVSICKACGVMT